MAVEPQGDVGAGQVRANLDLASRQVGDPVDVDSPDHLVHGADGQGADAGRGEQRGRQPAGAVPRIRSSAKFSASGLDGTVLIDCLPMLTGTVTLCVLTRQHAEHVDGRDHRLELDRAV